MENNAVSPAEESTMSLLSDRPTVERREFEREYEMNGEGNNGHIVLCLESGQTRPY